jgi:uncharacterized protein
MPIDRIFAAPSQSFFLLGPRGSGKSTWLRAAFADAKWFNLLDEGLFQRLLAYPEQFAGELRTLAAGSWVVVDEVQRLPNLLNEAHRFIEESELRFVLCGSSARKLKAAGVNLLAGRALRRHMHPFVPEELGSRFALEDALRHGLLPVVWSSPEKMETLSAYGQLYLSEQIQAEALVRNLPGYARFLPVAALFHGQTLNVTSLARDSGVSRTTVSSYLDILEETLMCFRVSGYEAKLRVRERKLPKLYWCDPGLVRAARGARGSVTPEERGALFEGLVAQLIRAYRDYRQLCADFHYWSPAGTRATEVDFLLDMDGEFVAVEAKAGSTFSQSWCRGLRAVQSLPGLRRRLIVTGGGPAMRTEDGIDVLPLGEFSQLLAAGDL